MAWAFDLVRPVGLYRFLTPLDKIQVGDIARILPTAGTERHQTAWSPIREGCEWSVGGVDILGASPSDCPEWEIIRPVNKRSTYVVLEQGDE